ncbi:hypothetical protein C2W64_01536 [Brevibacillus laterosporus]|nr:hypothetical protein C2W64_01536 [Brevibacillus laterosporus]
MKEFLLNGCMVEGVAAQLLVLAAAAYDYQQNEQYKNEAKTSASKVTAKRCTHLAIPPSLCYSTVYTYLSIWCGLTPREK